MEKVMSLTADDVLASVYVSLKERFPYQEFMFVDPEMEGTLAREDNAARRIVADSGGRYDRRTAWMLYECADLVAINGVRYIVAKGVIGGDTIGDRYEGDLFLAKAQEIHGIEGTRDE